MNPLLAVKAAKIAMPLAGGLAKGAVDVLGSLTGTGKTEDAAKSKVKKTADDFETMFLEQMVDRMMTSSETEGPLGENGTGGDVWRSMLGKEYAKQIQKSGGVGISSQVMNAMLKMQAGVSPGGQS